MTTTELLFLLAMLHARNWEEEKVAHTAIEARELLNTPITMLQVEQITDRFGKDSAACLIQTMNGAIRVFFAGEYAKRRPLIAARKNRLPMIMTLQAKVTNSGHTLYLFDGV